MNYQILLADEPITNDEWPILDYGLHHDSRHLCIPNAGLLDKTDISPQKFAIIREKIPYLFSFPTTDAYRFPFDIFSAVFYLATEYEKWADPVFDSHGRYKETAYESYKQKWYTYPLVHLYAEHLWEFIQAQFPRLERSHRHFTVQFTFDIDHPWKFLQKPLSLQIGGMGKDLLKGNLPQIQERLGTWISRKDPNQCFEIILKHFPPEWTHFFFLIARNSPYDGRFTHTHRAYVELIRTIAAKGFSTGIHPSYTSYLDSSRIERETQHLQGILKYPTSHSRQHFLRYRHPETFQFLLQAGIKAEYSLVNYETGGFRTGMALPYPWFDLSTNQETSLMLHPTHLMDVTLPQYLALEPEAGIAYAMKWVEATQQVGGEFVLLMHNDTLSNSGMWKGWREAWLGFVGEVMGRVVGSR
ncbi:MAG: polysaccharide deacetylase family protein [Bacteroidota bacterium]